MMNKKKLRAYLKKETDRAYAAIKKCEDVLYYGRLDAYKKLIDKIDAGDFDEQRKTANLFEKWKRKT